ncbi:TonB-dependent receptor [Desulfurella sp.]|uniref:TonB-dependent receptor n=1 Tax=Desulfurella sp. TaxID=1962857 RepID=UPI003D0E67AD
MKLKLKFILTSVFCLALFQNALAVNLDTIVVSASKVNQKIEDSPTYIQVLTKQKMEDNGNLFLSYMLNQLPGVSVEQGGGIGGETMAFIRGIPVSPKVMMDGVSIMSPYYPFPHFNLGPIMPDNIDRIEILQGAQSGLWGANAASGVINIITQKGKGKPHIDYNQTYGSFGTTKEYLALSGEIKKFNFYVAGSAYDTTGIPQTYSYNYKTHTYSQGGKRDGYHKYSFYSNLGYDFGDGLSANLITDSYKSTNYTDICKYSKDNPVCPNNSAPSNLTPLAQSSRHEVDYYFTKLNVEKKFEKATLNFETHYMQNNSYYYSPSSAPWKGRTYGASLNFSYNVAPTTKIVLGVDYGKDRAIYDYTPQINVSREHAGTFLEVLQTIQNLNLQASAREDHYQTFGNTFTYKLGANYYFEPSNTIFKANWGTGFVAPSMFDLYANGAPFRFGYLKGNPNLQPEKSKTFDIGFIQNFGDKLQISSSFFWSKIDNLIDTKYASLIGRSQYFIPINISKTISKGVESTLTYKPIKYLELSLSDTYTQSDGPFGQTSNIPYNSTSGALSFNYDRIYAQLNGQYISTMYDNSGHQIGRYTVFNANLSYKINNNAKIGLYAQNIFNRFYYASWGYGYATPPRSFYTTLSLKF